MLLPGIRAGHAEIIRSFDSQVRLQKDSSLDVTETIVMDFQAASRHGIDRTIPVKYDRYNNTYSIPFIIKPAIRDAILTSESAMPIH
jgi:hypothetical protein